MSKQLFTQQEIAPKILTKTDLEVSGSDFSQAVEPEKTNAKSKQTKTKILLSTYDIALISVFTAVGVVLNTFSSSFPKIELFGRFSLIYSYCILCGVMIGAIRGGVCVALADLLIAFIVPESGLPWMPLISISNFFMAFIPGIIYRLNKKNLNLTLLVSAIISFIVCTLGFTAAGETLLYYSGAASFYPSVTALVRTGSPVYFAFIIRKSITQPFWIILNLIIAKLILSSPAIKSILHTKRR